MSFIVIFIFVFEIRENKKKRVIRVYDFELIGKKKYN